MIESGVNKECMKLANVGMFAMNPDTRIYKQFHPILELVVKKLLIYLLKSEFFRIVERRQRDAARVIILPIEAVAFTRIRAVMLWKFSRQ